MDRRVTFQQLVGTRGATGEKLETWQDVCTVWAEVKTRNSRTFFSGSDEAVAESDTLFLIRHRTDLNTTMRVVFENTPYRVGSIIELGRREGLQIAAIALRV